MRCAKRAAVWAATHLAPGVDCATASGQLEGHELGEAGGAEVDLQHGLSEALVLVQEAQAQGHAIQQVVPGSRVEPPGLSSCTGLVHQLCMTSTGQPRGHAAAWWGCTP